MTFPFRSPASFIHRVGFLLRLFRNIASDVLGPGRQMGAFRSGGRAVRPARSPFTWPTPRKLRQSVRHLLPFSAPWHCLIWERECFLRRTRAHDPARRCRFLFVFPRALRYAACRARRSEPCDRNAVFPSLNNPRRDGYCQSIKDKFPQVSYFDSFGFLYRALSLSLSLSSSLFFVVRSIPPASYAAHLAQSGVFHSVEVVGFSPGAERADSVRFARRTAHTARPTHVALVRYWPVRIFARVLATELSYPMSLERSRQFSSSTIADNRRAIVRRRPP